MLGVWSVVAEGLVEELLNANLVDESHAVATGSTGWCGCTPASARFGFVQLDEGRVEVAVDYFRRTLELYRAAGETRGTGHALTSLGRAMVAAGGRSSSNMRESATSSRRRSRDDG